MLGILCLLSCLGTVFCGGIGVADPILQDAARTSIAYGNTEFLARYGFGSPFAGAAIAAPFAAAPYGAASYAAGPYAAAPFAAAPYATAVREGVFAAPLAAQVAHSAVAAPVGAFASPFLAARTAVAAPVAAVASPFVGVRAGLAAPAVATVTAAPFTAGAAVAAPYATVSAPVGASFVGSAPVVSSVGHVQGVAQVPVTKIEAQPALIQNVVDVANPKVATRKFEIRRPAIQKDFYDIEERVVVKPAGSAVVELDQPISKNQRGPTVVSPAPEPLVASAPVRALHVGHAVQGQAIYPTLSAFPVHSYPVHDHSLHPVFPSVGVTPIPLQPTGPSTPRPILPDLPEDDDTESVSIENAELGRSRIGQQQQRQGAGELDGYQIQRILEQARAQGEARAQQEIQARAKILAEEREQLEIQARARIQAEERAQKEILARARMQAEERAQQEIQARARIQAQQQLVEQQQFFEQQQQQQLQARLRSQQTLQRQSNIPAPVRENIEITSRTGGGFASGLARISSQAEEIPSVRNLPEVEQSNQARLIALLTERGPVSEVRSGAGLDSRVRARVLSATPAPRGSLAEDEKISTRRVVVNRPIQTVQEVDVVEPFTKIERVSVQQPALIKTARLGVANVATAVPVHAYTHAHYAF